MATMYLETPARVLQRVQELEDMELPSLPSFQHNIDYDSESGMESSDQGSNRSEMMESEIDPATPHPIRMQASSTASGKTFTQTTTLTSPAETSSTSSASPFPPLDTSAGPTPSSSANTVALTSTPHSQSRSRRYNSTVTTTDRRESAVTLKSSTSSRKDVWSTPGQMSTSFDGEEIPVVINEELGDEMSIPLNDASASFDHSRVSGTPVTRRLSKGHVLLQRPGRRGQSSALQALQQIQDELQDSPATALYIPAQDRIPSLSRSEVSVADTSGGASTPEGPMRVMAVDTSTSRTQNSVFYDPEPSSPGGVEQPTTEYAVNSEITDISLPLPSQQDIDHSSSAPTPGIARLRSASDDTHNASPSRQAPLGDITTAQNVPFTPSPANRSKFSDFSTPRPILDDAERRKNHVLAVLSSTGLPTRVMRSVKGTPHPLRRVSVAPHSASIAEEGTPVPGGHSSRSIDQSENESFVSIASSADLTSDRRASHLPNHLARGNTSFPNILLPTGGVAPSPGGSLRDGLSDKRVDGAKLHKHLNAMNQQLLQENGELAKEAVMWRDEVERLRIALAEAGVDVGDLPEIENVSFTDLPHRRRRWRSQSPDGSLSSPRKDESWQTKLDRQSDRSGLLVSQLSQLGRRDGTPSESVRRMVQDSLEVKSPEEHVAAMQEMAEKLEALEEGLEEKEQMIRDLEGELHARPAASDSELQGQVEELGRQLADAERAREELHAEFASKTEQHAKQFGEICAGFEEQVKSLEKDLQAARDELDGLRQEKARAETLASKADIDEKGMEWKKQISELETTVGRAKKDVAQKESELVAQKEALVGAMEGKDAAEMRAKETENCLGDLEAQLKSARTAERELQTRLEKAASELEQSEGNLHAAEEDLLRTSEQVADLQQSGLEQEAELERQFGEIQQLSTRIQELESALDDSATHDEIEDLKRQLEEANHLLMERDADLEEMRGRLDRTMTIDQTLPDHSMIADLEERLDEAHREIGRLKHDLLATPHRQSAIEIRDARIKSLEREKLVLQERLAGVKTPSVIDAGSPFTRSTPLINRAIASLRTPKTPGPLKDLSWLNTTVDDPNEPVLTAQIQYLQAELQNANSQLDTNFDRLESAGLSAVALAEKLAAAQDRVAQLDSELAGLRSGKQNVQTAQKESIALSKALEDVHRQMAQLKSDMGAERERINMDNRRLTDLVSELKLKSQKEVEVFRHELDRVAEEAEQELYKLRKELQAAADERDTAQNDLRSLGVKSRKLERELVDRQNALDELTARHARQQRNLPPQADETDKREIIRLRASLGDVQTQADQLRDDLTEKGRILRKAEDKVDALERERESVTQELRVFERDLEVQRKECSRFGAALHTVKLQQDGTASAHAAVVATMERDLRTVRERLQVAQRDLDQASARYAELFKWKTSHICDSGKQQALDDQKMRFKIQSRELAGQVRYLKAKYTREATFRNALALQKRYLLLLVGSMSLHEQASLKIIATMGFPMPAPSRPKRTLKTVGLAVIALIRARKQADQWRAEVTAKTGMTNARRIRN